MASHDDAQRRVSWPLPARCRWAVVASGALYAGACWLLLTSGWWGGDRAAGQAVVKHRWELEARGRPAWVEQAMPPGPTLDMAGRLGRRERPSCMGRAGKRWVNAVRGRSRQRGADPLVSRAASPTQAGRRW